MSRNWWDDDEPDAGAKVSSYTPLRPGADWWAQDMPAVNEPPPLLKRNPKQGAVERPKMGMGKAFVRGAMDGATFNTADEIAGAMATADAVERVEAPRLHELKRQGKMSGAAIRDFNMRRDSPEFRAELDRKRSVIETVGRPAGRGARETVRAEQRQARQDRPVTYLGGQVAGGLATLPVGGAAAKGVGAGVNVASRVAAPVARAIPGATQIARAGQMVAAPFRAVGRMIDKVPVLAPFLKAAGQGGTAGTGYAGLAAAGDAEDGGRFMAAVDALPAGFLTGAGLGVGAKALGSAVGLVTNVLGRTPDEKAVATIARMMNQDGLTPQQVAQVVAERSRNGTPLFETAGEMMGPQVRGLQTALGNVPGPSKERLQATFTDSIRNMGRNIMATAKKATGKDPERFYAEKAAQEASRKATDRAGYSAVIGDPMAPNRPPVDAFRIKLFNPDPNRPELAPVAFRPRFQKFVEQVYRDAVDDGDVMADELGAFLKTIRDKGVPNEALSVRAINEIDKAIGQSAQEARVAGRGRDASLLQDLQEALRTTDFDTGLGKVRTQSSVGLTAKDAFDLGRDAFKRGIDIEEVVGSLENTPQEVADAFTTGMVRSLADTLANQSNLGGLADAASAIARTPAMRDKIVAALPKTKAGKLTVASQRFMDMLERVPAHTNQAKSVYGGSATAPRQAAIEGAEAATSSVSADVFDLAGEILTRQPGRVMQRLGEGVRNRVTRPGIYNPQINEALGRRVGATGRPNIQGVLDEVDQFNSRPAPRLADERIPGVAGRVGGAPAGTASAQDDPWATAPMETRASAVVDAFETPLIEEYLSPDTSEVRRRQIETMFGEDAPALRAILSEE